MFEAHGAPLIQSQLNVCYHVRCPSLLYPTIDTNADVLEGGGGVQYEAVAGPGRFASALRGVHDALRWSLGGEFASHYGLARSGGTYYEDNVHVLF